MTSHVANDLKRRTHLVDTSLEKLSSAWAIFQGLLLEAIPFLLAGVAIAGMARWLSPQTAWVHRLPKNPLLAPLTGVLMGFALPACECGNVPVARRLLASGAPMGKAFGFLFAAPVLNPIVLASTWVAFSDQPWLLIARPLGAFVIAVLLSLLLSVVGSVYLALMPYWPWDLQHRSLPMHCWLLLLRPVVDLKLAGQPQVD